jgi:multidrug efflux pump subunit AcrB
LLVEFMDSRDRFNISRIAIAHPWLTVGFWIALCVAGFFALRTLNYALLPDITFPVVVVTANLSNPQSAPDTAREISLPIEQRLKSLGGLDQIRASIRPGFTVVTLSFQVGQKLDRCAERVTSALRDVKLPAAVTTKVTPRNLNQTSVATYALAGAGKSPADLEPLARNRIIPSLKAVPGVQEVVVLGSSSADADTRPTISRFNGEDVLALDVIKEGDANTLNVVDRIESAVGRLRAQLPQVHLVLARTQADYIREASHSTVEALLIAVVSSVLVIFPFLWSWPATAISGLAIPTSLLGTAIVMAACGFELDTITLLALAVVIGIIIDDAIVDVENIARHLEEGRESPREAALGATKEIGLTVAAATFTIVAVFLPVGLMKGSVGQFFKPFGVTVSAAVIISLLVARTLSPTLAVWWMRARGRAARTDSIWSAFVRWYPRALDWALDHPKSVLAMAALSFLVGLALIPLVPRGLIPRLDRGEFKIVYRVAPAALARSGATPASPLEKAREVATRLEKSIRSFSEIKAIYTLVGSQGDPTRGVLYVRLAGDRKRHTAETEDFIRRDLPRIDDVTTSVEDVPFIDIGDQKPIDFALIGDDPAAIAQCASRLVDRLRKVAGFVDVTSSASDLPEGGQLEHLGARPAVFITANLAGGVRLSEAAERVVTLSREILPSGVSVELGGDSANIKQVFTSFGITLGLAVVCILAVLLLLFRNWVDPFVIVLAMPLAIVGAVLGLLVVRSEFGMISLIGVVFLFGLVNKNAILLVDYINQLRARGTECREAIRRAGAQRLRPILMTTLATILGMMPVAIGLGAGSELRAPMAVAIIGGLVTSTLLSLLIVPVVYASLRRARRSESPTKGDAKRPRQGPLIHPGL